MDFKERDFEYIEKLMQMDLFHTKYDRAFDFLPDTICDWALDSSYHIEVENILNWGDFEEGRLDFDETVFLDLIQKKGKIPADTRVLFISDECFKIKAGFEFELKNYLEFVYYYEDRFQISFFQPADYILIFPDLLVIVLIYHEGKLVYINR